MRNTKRYNYLSFISFKILPICTLLSATVKVLETYWKPFCESLFSSFVAFLMGSVASQNRRPFRAYFGGEIRQKSAGVRSGEWGGCSSVVTLLFAVKSINKSSVLRHCEGETS